MSVRSLNPAAPDADQSLNRTLNPGGRFVLPGATGGVLAGFAPGSHHLAR